MRPSPTVGLSVGEVVEFGLIHLSPLLPYPPTGLTTCVSHTCRWWLYSGSKEFEANAAMIIIVILSALISALGLNTAIRCFLRGGIGNPSNCENNSVPQSGSVATASCLKAAPKVIYTAEMKVKLAGAEAECAICLSEFMEGEGIRVLRRCKHGFHAQCIKNGCLLTPLVQRTTPCAFLSLHPNPQHHHNPRRTIISNKIP
ncbi:unnamed protein product [Malus baccata var. baccata]